METPSLSVICSYPGILLDVLRRSMNVALRDKKNRITCGMMNSFNYGSGYRFFFCMNRLLMSVH